MRSDTNAAGSTVGAHDAKTNLARLLDRVENGEVIVITRHGAPIARLVPFVEPIDQDRVKQAIDGIRHLQRGLSLDGHKVEDLIHEGRKS
ncbi:MAG TPA: type II toxin-antitoxin system prevent-host-death family antitoxin [Planctomycetota bacterium]|nr:type II toxin-antitoxin system prevent-host-death family antitoxin [Planctomycetota bacterium]